MLQREIKESFEETDRRERISKMSSAILSGKGRLYDSQKDMEPEELPAASLNGRVNIYGFVLD